MVINPFDLADQGVGSEQTSMVGLATTSPSPSHIQPGLIPADNIEITDYIPSGFTFNAG